MYQRLELPRDQGPQRFYAALAEALRHALEGERDWIANLANTAALLADQLDELNWVGFYLLRRRSAQGTGRDGEAAAELVVGPFQGKPACTRIALGRGVCGTAALQRRSVVVPDVHAFPGHIACDAASRSELVVPMITPEGRLAGVLDLDSPRPSRFTEDDARGLETVVATLLASSDLPPAGL
ncbi:MAG: GAF domain-containing protein [Tepidisphaerales bacterium]